MKRIFVTKQMKQFLQGAILLAFGALAFAPGSARASTASNTVITNTATVNYSDAGNTPQTAVTSSASVTVSLVPSAVLLSSPAAVTTSQGQNTVLTYTVTDTANGPDTYNLGSVATPTNDSTVTPTFTSPISLSGTTLASATTVGSTTITVPYDNVASNASINGLLPGNTVSIGGVTYLIAAAGISKSAGTNTATVTLTTAISSVVAAGQIVGQQTTFTVTVPSGTVTSGSSGSQSVSTTVTSTTAPNPATTQGTPTVIAVNRPTLTVVKVVSTNNGTSYSASGSTAPPGTALIYQIVASNTGTTSATSVAFTDALPPFLTYLAGSGKFATSTATAYSAATALTEGSGGYTATTAAGVTTVAYAPGSPGTGTVAGSGVLVLYFKATIN